MFRVMLGSAKAHIIALTAALVVGSLSAAAPGRPADCAIGIIETIAGGDIGDGRPATQASMQRPTGVALGPDGSLYIADWGLRRIRKVDAQGVITTVAGNGLIGESVDGLPAVEAPVSCGSMAVGPDGSIYFATIGRVRRIDPAGILTTVAGDGTPGYSGDGGPAIKAKLYPGRGIAIGADGSLYIADSGNYRIRKVDTEGVITTVAGNGERGYSGDGGPAINAGMTYPSDIALDAAGSLYIADSWDNRIRKVDRGAIITTVAGTGRDAHSGDGGAATEAGLSGPRAVAVGPDGSVYVAERGSQPIRKIDPTGVITTVAGDGRVGGGQGRFAGDGGPATAASLNSPEGLAVAPDGTVYIADVINRRIRKIDPVGIITTVAGGAVGDGRLAAEASLYAPEDAVFGPDGSLYIADTRNNRVRKIDPAGVITTIAGDGSERYSGDGGPAIEASLYSPSGVAVAADGSVYIADRFNRRIRKVDPTGIISTVAGNGPSGGPEREGTYSGDGGPATEAGFEEPYSVALGGDGSILIADGRNSRIRRVDPGGTITTLAPLAWPQGLTMAPDGSLYVASADSRIHRVDRRGEVSTVAGDGWESPMGGGRFAGDGGSAAEASLSGPRDTAVAPDGSLYIADTRNHRIRKIDPEGIITTVAGDGHYGRGGDGAPATEASLGSPASVAIGPDGSLCIVDTDNHRIRRVRWWPCEEEALRALIDERRDRAGESAEAWSNVAKWHLVAEAWEEAVSAAERALALTSEGNEPARMRAEILVARAYLGKRDDHEARRRLLPILARASDFGVLRDAADLLVDLHLLRGERDQAIATLNDLLARAQDYDMHSWAQERLNKIANQ